MLYREKEELRAASPTTKEQSRGTLGCCPPPFRLFLAPFLLLLQDL